MHEMLERWNDDKMDALDAKVDAVDAKVDALADRTEKGFMRVDAELREQRQELKAGFDRIHRLMIQFCGMMLAALIGLIGTQL